MEGPVHDSSSNTMTILYFIIVASLHTSRLLCRFKLKLLLVQLAQMSTLCRSTINTQLAQAINNSESKTGYETRH